MRFIYNTQLGILYWHVSPEGWHWADMRHTLQHDDLDRAEVLVGAHRHQGEGLTPVTDDEARAIYASIRARRALAGQEDGA